LTALGPPSGRKESSLASKISPPFKFLFNSAFGSKAIVESMELEKLMAPVEQHGLNADPVAAAPIDGVPGGDVSANALLQGAEIIKVEDEEEVEHMDGDSKILFSKEEINEKDESKK
jgi:hypothetical protein